MQVSHFSFHLEYVLAKGEGDGSWECVHKAHSVRADPSKKKPKEQWAWTDTRTLSSVIMAKKLSSACSFVPSSWCWQHWKKAPLVAIRKLREQWKPFSAAEGHNDDLLTPRGINMLLALWLGQVILRENVPCIFRMNVKHNCNLRAQVLMFKKHQRLFKWFFVWNTVHRVMQSYWFSMIFNRVLLWLWL